MIQNTKFDYEDLKPGVFGDGGAGGIRGDEGDPPADPTDPPADPTDPPADPPVSFMEYIPETWREDMAGEEELRLNVLKRTADMPAFVNRFFDLHEQVSKGEIAAADAPDEHSTEEEWAAYREQHSIPATAADYELSLDEGLALGEDDGPMMEGIYTVAHEHNLPTEAMSSITNAYLKARQEEDHQFAVTQEGYKNECINVLKTSMKGEYETNMNLVKGTFIAAMPEAVREGFEHAIMPDGRKIMNSPEILIALSSMARTLNPAATVVQNSSNPIGDIDSELASIKSKMGTDEYNTSKEMQARYRQLLTAKENLARQ